jgi:hypothetical protein
MLEFNRYVRPSAGDTYLLRVIALEKNDTTVAIKILKIDRDGSMTIAWNRIAQLPTPFVLYISDQELWKVIEDVRVKENIACGEFIVKDNVLTFLGPWNDNNGKLENALNLHGVERRYRQPDADHQ